MAYTFKNKRLMTRGIDSRVPLSIQICLWGLVDNLVNSDVKTDYLQVFELKTNKHTDKSIYLHIEHRQEVPPYKREYTIKNVEAEINDKIYIIDDGTHSTMLFASEY